MTSCPLVIAERAYAPPDPNLSLLDAQLKVYIAGVQAYMATLM